MVMASCCGGDEVLTMVGPKMSAVVLRESLARGGGGGMGVVLR